MTVSFKKSPVTVGHLRKRLEGIPDDVTIKDEELARWLMYPPEDRRYMRIARRLGSITGFLGAISLMYIAFHFIDKYW